MEEEEEDDEDEVEEKDECCTPKAPVVNRTQPCAMSDIQTHSLTHTHTHTLRRRTEHVLKGQKQS